MLWVSASLNYFVEDVAIAPLLWRFEHYGIEVTKGLAPVMKYAERLFSREAFIDSLTANEKAMRK